MKIEYVPPTPKVEEVPFVLGGVYRYVEYKNDLRVLVRPADGAHALFSPTNGHVQQFYPDEATARKCIPERYAYVPDAKLVIPDTAK